MTCTIPAFNWQVALVILAIIWELIWKGLALWRAGHNRQAGWFVAILLLNTLGILPIIYLLYYDPGPEQPAN